jgi:hypothetical protein
MRSGATLEIRRDVSLLVTVRPAFILSPSERPPTLRTFSHWSTSYVDMSKMEFGKIGATPASDQSPKTALSQGPQHDLLSALSPAPDPMAAELTIRPHSKASVSTLHRSGTIGDTSISVTFTTAA